MYYNDYICKGFSCFATPSKSVFSVIYYIVSPRQQRKGEGGGGGGGGSLCKSRIMHTSSIHIMANYNNLFFFTTHITTLINSASTAMAARPQTRCTGRTRQSTEYISCLPFPVHDNNTQTRAGPLIIIWSAVVC